MSTIEERLDKVRELIQDDDFLEGTGLSNDPQRGSCQPHV